MALRAGVEVALCLVELRGFEPLPPCMPCSVAPCRRSRSGSCAQPNSPLRVTVTDRYIPLVTAAYGTRVARPERTTSLAPGGNGSQLGRAGRAVLWDHPAQAQ